MNGNVGAVDPGAPPDGHGRRGILRNHPDRAGNGQRRVFTVVCDAARQNKGVRVFRGQDGATPENGRYNLALPEEMPAKPRGFRSGLPLQGLFVQRADPYRRWAEAPVQQFVEEALQGGRRSALFLEGPRGCGMQTIFTEVLKGAPVADLDSPMLAAAADNSPKTFLSNYA